MNIKNIEIMEWITAVNQKSSIQSLKLKVMAWQEIWIKNNSELIQMKKELQSKRWTPEVPYEIRNCWLFNPHSSFPKIHSGPWDLLVSPFGLLIGDVTRENISGLHGEQGRGEWRVW